jgi:hypothetical protein
MHATGLINKSRKTKETSSYYCVKWTCMLQLNNIVTTRRLMLNCTIKIVSQPSPLIRLAGPIVSQPSPLIRLAGPTWILYEGPWAPLIRAIGETLQIAGLVFF